MCDFFGAILDHGFLRDVRKCHVVAHAATQCSSFDQLHKVIILWPNGPNVSTRSTPENAFCSLEGF